MSESGIPWDRYLAALKRRRALVAGIVVAAVALGFVATRFFRPTYEVHSTIWLANGASTARPNELPGNERLLAAPAWGEVLRSYTVLDPVVDAMSLFVTPAHAADSAIVDGFHATPTIAAGKYRLEMSADGRSYTLKDKDGKTVERGTPGDSIGRALGFRWAPTPATLGRDRTIEFTVVNPRQAAIKLRDRLVVGFPDTSFLSVRLTGPRPARDAAILNAIGRQFVTAAATLTSGSQSQSAQQLEAQLAQAQAKLRTSEDALRSYRAGTVGLPSQDPATGARDPSFNALYDQRAQLDSIRADRQALQRVLAAKNDGQGLDAAALLAIPSVREAPEMTGALADLTKAESNLQALRRTYTDEFASVREARAEVDRIKQRTLPALAQGVLDRLRNRENALSSRVASASGALRSVPGRAIDEQRLERDVEMNTAIYTALRNQYDGARLSEVAAVPGVAVLDSAVAPLEPVTNTVPGILLASLLAGVALAIAAALLLDATDKRLWYPEQIEALGYEIVGAIPRANVRRGVTDPVAAGLVSEACRALRLNILNAVLGARPVMLSILSAEPGDGKSFVSAELARCFAQAGQRTILVDGDVRRGGVDQTFAVDRAPGFTDYLAGHATLDAVIRPTAQKNLSVVPSGTRLAEGPELIGSPALPAALAALAARCEVLLVDTPPLGAGADAAALATASGNAVLVIRAGKTDRKAAKARLAFIERLPVRMFGVVLNAIRAEGMFAAYAYLPEYAVFAPKSYGATDPARSAEGDRSLADVAPSEPESDESASDAAPAARAENHW